MKLPVRLIPTVPAQRAAAVLRAASVAILLAAATTTPSAAQHRSKPGEPEALHGSKESVEKMYDFALRHHYPFYLTPTNIDTAAARGRLVELTGDSTYELTRGVQAHYATREVRQFVTMFAPQYLFACGSPLTVTSAARALSHQPRNANPHSVHPTGIAVDFRRPPPGPCLTWVRNALAQLESRGIVEATEEHHPIHLHVAVLETPGSRFALPNLVQGMTAAARVPSVPVPSVNAVANGDVTLGGAGAGVAHRTYVVRQGDTIFDIASRVGVPVKAILTANGRSASSVLKPGTTLSIPDSNDQRRPNGR